MTIAKIFQAILTKYGVTESDLRTAAGDDWDTLLHDLPLLVDFAEALATRLIRESGRVPPSYTGTTTCSHCGPVPIFAGCPATVEGCPWCFNRAAGKPIPAIATEPLEISNDAA